MLVNPRGSTGEWGDGDFEIIRSDERVVPGTVLLGFEGRAPPTVILGILKILLAVSRYQRVGRSGQGRYPYPWGSSH